ncbi:hypothetical protein U3516DRAFT_761980 [Neocallimastix sp. 'constans']
MKRVLRLRRVRDQPRVSVVESMNEGVVLYLVYINNMRDFGLEPALPKGNGLAGHRVNHSAKVTTCLTTKK